MLHLSQFVDDSPALLKRFVAQLAVTPFASTPTSMEQTYWSALLKARQEIDTIRAQSTQVNELLPSDF